MAHSLTRTKNTDHSQKPARTEHNRTERRKAKLMLSTDTTTADMTNLHRHYRIRYNWSERY